MACLSGMNRTPKWVPVVLCYFHVHQGFHGLWPQIFQGWVEATQPPGVMVSWWAAQIRSSSFWQRRCSQPRETSWIFMGSLWALNNYFNGFLVGFSWIYWYNMGSTIFTLWIPMVVLAIAMETRHFLPASSACPIRLSDRVGHARPIPNLIWSTWSLAEC